MNYAELVLAIEHLRAALRFSDAGIGAARRAMFVGNGLMADRDLDAAVSRMGQASMLLRDRINTLDALRIQMEAED